MNARQAISALFEKHQLDLQRLIMNRFRKLPHEAEDIVQDAFHNILRADNIDAVENPKAYLYQTASNLALNRIKKNQQHTQYLAAFTVDEPEALDQRSPERSFSAYKDLKKLEDSIDQLPEKYRRTFLLSRMQDKTYGEISEMLNISESTVEKHIIKTLKFLRDQLDVEEVER